MRHRIIRFFNCLLILVFVAGLVPYSAAAAEASEDPVSAVIRQLEEIDTLEQMQAKRASYAVKSRYTVSTTDSSVITAQPPDEV